MICQSATLALSRSRLLHNVQLLRNHLGTRPALCATIKANAYGHGVLPIATLLQEAHITWCCVYSLEEALAIAHLPWHGILVLAPFVETVHSRISETLEHSLLAPIRLTITDIDSARRLSLTLGSRRMNRPLNVHIQIDTGLTRIGVDPDRLPALVAAIESLPNLHLEGLFAHLSHGDVRDHESLAQQMSILQTLAAPLKKRLPHLLIHLQNSGGSFHLPPHDFDLVRCGIALYGLQASTRHPIPNLLPIAQLTAPILAIHERPPHTGVGYGHTFVTTRHSRLAIVPVGYADGYPRALSNHSIAQVHSIDVPVIGRVSMDQLILDLTDIPTAAIGDTATVISHDPTQPNSIDRMADTLDTISYELTTHWSSRLRRITVE
jgi:alanine racemase